MTPRGERQTRGSPTDARKHWEKAKRFRLGATRANEQGHWESAMSEAITAVIHVASALSIRFTGVRSSGQDHHESIKLLAGSAEFDPTSRDLFVDHLRVLLSLKGLVQYSSDTFDATDAHGAMTHMNRAFDAARPVVQDAGWGPIAAR
jgi:hypothetical protein